ncbi:MAG: flagellar motor protein MotB [Steroidobacteraceae bacterium]|jgi:chemotaxis protein MotB|nr:flagellar motor protein MotB [Steroidobacteraceae bacterium]
MAADKEGKRPIIIKKKKVIAGGHHGGAWKVAYADFVTAMMAFFMVMWLVSTVSKEQRAAIFDYFQNPSMEPGKAPKPAPGQAGPGGASTSPINLRGGLDAPRTFSRSPDIGGPVAQIGAAAQGEPPDVSEAQKIAEAAERAQLESLMAELREAISKSQALEPFKDQLLLDITPEGLRIQIVDAQNRPMFDLGGSTLKNYTDVILRELSPYLSSVPNRISLTGHTDTTPYSAQAGYTNWELSADRANAARRALERGGLAADKVARVVGLSSSVLFDKTQPRNPVNRRISIIVMTKRAEEAALKTDVPVTPGGADVAAAAGEPASAAVSGADGTATVAAAGTGAMGAPGGSGTPPPIVGEGATPKVDPMANQPLPPPTRGTPNWVPPVPSVAPARPTIASAQETAAAARAILEKQPKP